MTQMYIMQCLKSLAKLSCVKVLEGFFGSWHVGEFIVSLKLFVM
uniref:Uncharacterized protein n=1 Tax=Rhizophora mucronata TaxID=61149 RepID=A0A2P2P091_RHIMU